MAGSVCANFLAKRGRKVLLLEQNHHAGGNMSGFWRKGFYFDGGDQSFESLGLVFPILRELGVYDDRTWTKARYRMVSKDFDFFIDSLGEVEAALLEAFPNEPGIREMFAEINDVSRFLSDHYDAERFPALNDLSVGKLWSFVPWLRKLWKWSKFSYREKVCSVIRDPSLRNWFTNIGYYRMPYLFFAGFWHIWAYDYWYPQGGMQALHDALIRAFEGHGGTVRFNTGVAGITIHDGRATGVTTDAGEVLSADTVVYAGDYKSFVGGLVPVEHFAPKFVRAIHESRLTEALVTVYLGVDREPKGLAEQLQGHHVFFFPNYNVVFPDASSPADIHRNMWVALNFFGEENPGLAPSGKSSVTVQTYSSDAWENYWHNGSHRFPRTEEYRAFKDEVGMQLVRTAENVMPGLRDSIEYYEVGTPLSLERFTRNSEGSTGGWCYDDKVSPVFRRWGLNMFKTPIDRLYATGHYALWPGGVISAAMSGRLVANLVDGRPLLEPLPSATEG